MTAAFAGAAALLPELFFLDTQALTGGDWLNCGLITACGAAILLIGARIAARFDQRTCGTGD